MKIESGYVDMLKVGSGQWAVVSGRIYRINRNYRNDRGDSGYRDYSGQWSEVCSSSKTFPWLCFVRPILDSA